MQQLYLLTYPDGVTETGVPSASLALRLGLKEASLRVQVAQAHGALTRRIPCRQGQGFEQVTITRENTLPRGAPRLPERLTGSENMTMNERLYGSSDAAPPRKLTEAEKDELRRRMAAWKPGENKLSIRERYLREIGVLQ